MFMTSSQSYSLHVIYYKEPDGNTVLEFKLTSSDV